jgi:hypothetical protein
LICQFLAELTRNRTDQGLSNPSRTQAWQWN